MSRFRFMAASLALALASSMSGAFLLISHLPYAHLLLGMSIVATLAFMGTALAEVLTSRRATGNAKVLWTALLVFGGTLGGLFYLLLGRKSVAPALE